MNEATLNPAWQTYDSSFRRDAHQLLAWGYRDALPDIHSDCQENDITGFIYREIKKVLKHPDTDEKFDRYSVKNEDPTEGEDRRGNSRCRLDLIVEDRVRPRKEYIFEAKRLKKSSHPISGYTGEHGLGCFIRGTAYATGLPEAAMVAYVQNLKISDWEKQLVNALLPINVEKSREVKELKNCWVSQHNRADNTIIKIHHIFLDCTAVTPNPPA